VLRVSPLCTTPGGCEPYKQCDQCKKHEGMINSISPHDDILHDSEDDNFYSPESDDEESSEDSHKPMLELSKKRKVCFAFCFSLSMLTLFFDSWIK